MNREYASLSQIIDRIAAMPNGRPLAEVLKIVQKDTDSSKVRVSSDLRRATLEVPDGGLVSVRVTAARQSAAHGPWLFRFKSPSDTKRFRALFFGGLNRRGVAVVHKLAPADIGSKKTITLPAIDRDRSV
jgi:hypothetical protein